MGQDLAKECGCNYGDEDEARERRAEIAARHAVSVAFRVTFGWFSDVFGLISHDFTTEKR